MNATSGRLTALMGCLIAFAPSLAHDIRAAATAPRTTVWVAAAERAIHPGDTVTVAIRIQKAAGVGSVPFTLRYDPEILELIASSPREGEFLRQGGTSTSFIARPGSPGQGGGLVVGLSRLGTGRGARGKGTLCRVTFRARQPGVGALTFARSAVLDPTTRPLAATFQGASLTVRRAP